MIIEKKKIFVGLSGGVDSAVAAKLLLDQGYAVTGVFIKIWQPEFSACTWEKDRLDAKRVAVALGIPFLEVDFSEAYKRQVVNDMVSAYKRGLTPNPDVLCNRFIKFGIFKQWAREHGADLIATGHYANIRLSLATLQAKPDVLACVEPKNGHLGERFELHRGKDTAKDQAYFLYRLTEEDLKDILFPIGEYTKNEVRAIAQRAGLPNANRPDSQGLCFVGEVSIGEFLSHYILMEKGNVLDTDGNIIGTHEGAARYTIGERHGFTLHTSENKAHYITATDTVKNTITVSSEKNDVHTHSVALTDTNWINEKPEVGKWYDAEVRYHQKPHRARISYTGGKTTLTFTEPQIVARGQSVVLYDGLRVLGGGIVT